MENKTSEQDNINSYLNKTLIDIAKSSLSKSSLSSNKNNYYDDKKTKVDINFQIDMFQKKSEQILPKIIKSFSSEDLYIKLFRYIFSVAVIVVLAISLVIFVKICNTVLKTNEINLLEIASVFSVLIVETIGLMTIIFKYLFNREHNKVLDVLIEYLKVESSHSLNSHKLKNEIDSNNKTKLT